MYASLGAVRGWEISIVVGSNWRTEYGANVASGQLLGSHDRVMPIPVVLSGNIPLHAYRARLTDLISAEKPDAIYVYHEPYAVSTYQVFVANALSARAPIGFYSSQNILKRYPFPFRSMERWVYRKAEFAVTISKDVVSVLRKKGYAGRLAIVPFEIDLDHFSSQGHGTSWDSVGPLRIGYVGRLVPEKGVDTLIRALALLRSTPFCARIVGNGRSANELRLLAGQILPRSAVQWDGYVSNGELPDVYRGLDVLVVPSRTTERWKEQFGRVVLEALACGTAVVTSDSGELPVLVGSTGGGWTFREGDSHDLAERLAYISGHRQELTSRRTVGNAAVKASFGLDRIASRLADAITGSLEAGNSACL